MKKIGIITFHNSYNCGSMLESYAIQEFIKKTYNCDVKIINFSSIGQQQLYSVFYKNNNLKNIIRNLMILPYSKRIQKNNEKYELFKNNYFNLTSFYSNNSELSDKGYDVIVSGSDQIWNITISDYDDAYFLNWVKNAKKVAYAPSFGAKNIVENTKNVQKYKKMLNQYDAISVREENGRRWIKELINIDVPVLIDPTLLLNIKDYEKLIAKDIKEEKKYIFFYCPSFNTSICKFVRKLSIKYNLDVITWSTKSYGTKFVKRFGFKLADYENPESYLYYIKNAELILTTSFHGTIFSTIFQKRFFTLKNGGMYGNDDRVKTLLNQLEMENRCITYNFIEDYDYMKEVDYSKYTQKLNVLRKKAVDYLDTNVGGTKNEVNK